MRAQLAQRTVNHELARELFEQTLQGTSQFHDRHFALFPLVRSLDALKRYDEAFAAMVEAHESQLAHLKLTAPLALASGTPTWEIAKWSCDPNDIEQWNAADPPSMQDSPIFVVAFPRSGTTLLEQALDAHPALRSMDEQPYLQEAISSLSGPGVSYPDRLAGLAPERLEAARARYWELVAERVRLQPGEQLIDKNPLNILRLPAIARLFPHAKIVLAVRHPCDVLVSCFMQHFRAEFAWHCRDLETLALAFRRTVDYWYAQAAVLPVAVHEVRYETLVRQFEPEVRRLAMFLEVPWAGAMLDPAAHALRKGFISTPSYSQVLAPVHDKSAGRWRHYARQLAPVLGELRGVFERWGYDA